MPPPSSTTISFSDLAKNNQPVFPRRCVQVVKGAPGVSLTQVPYFDVEVRNVYGLRFMAQTLFAPKD